MNTTTAQQSGPSDAAIAQAFREYLPAASHMDTQCLMDKIELRAEEIEARQQSRQPNCPSCEGYGHVGPGIDEAPITVCNHCDGTGYIDRQLQAAGGEGECRKCGAPTDPDYGHVGDCTPGGKYDKVDRWFQEQRNAVKETPPAGGFVVVPREPTGDMIRLGGNSVRSDACICKTPHHKTADRAARNAYVTMIAAAPTSADDPNLAWFDATAQPSAKDGVRGDDGILWMQDESGQLDPRAALAYAKRMRDYLAAFIGHDFKQTDPSAVAEHNLGMALDNLEECASMLMNLASRHLPATTAAGLVDGGSPVVYAWRTGPSGWHCSFDSADAGDFDYVELKATAYDLVGEGGYRAMYEDLIYQVGNKYEGESRHATAKRYLQQAEQPIAGGVSEPLDPREALSECRHKLEDALAQHGESAAYEKWFGGEQGKPYDGMWQFARAAWMARAALQSVWPGEKGEEVESDANTIRAYAKILDDLALYCRRTADDFNLSQSAKLLRAYADMIAKDNNTQPPAGTAQGDDRG